MRKFAGTTLVWTFTCMLMGDIPLCAVAEVGTKIAVLAPVT
jgi:hypothetical protein